MGVSFLLINFSSETVIWLLCCAFFLSFFCWLLFCAFFLASFLFFFLVLSSCSARGCFFFLGLISCSSLLFFFLVLRGVVSSFLDFVWGVTYCSIKGLVSRVFARYYYKIFLRHTSIENKEVNTTYKALLP